MTRQEYLGALARELEGFDEASRKDILLEIEDHLDEMTRLHPELDEETIVGGLEKPAVLAASLAAELGGKQERPAAEEAHGQGERAGREGPGWRGADSEEGEGRRRSSRITIDGQDVESIIRQAFDVARLFKGRHFYTEDFEREEGDEGPAKRTVVKDIPLFGAKKIVVKTRSADVQVLLSTKGLTVTAEGDYSSKLNVTAGNEGAMLVSTRGGKEEPDSIEVRVPPNAELLVVDTASGDVEVVDRVGDLEIQTASGDVEVRACSGSVVVVTASGEVAIAGCSEKVKIRTASGDVSMEAEGSCESIDLASSSGDLELRYPKDFDAMIRWKTLSGDVVCDCPASGQGSAILGAGLSPVSLLTTSGDIAVLHR